MRLWLGAALSVLAIPGGGLSVSAPHGSGVRVSFPDLVGSFVESGCRVGAPASTGPVRFAVPYAAQLAGPQLLEVAVTAPGCGVQPEAARATVPIEMAAPPAPAPDRCAGRARVVVLCLVNAARVAAGAGRLHTLPALRGADVRRLGAPAAVVRASVPGLGPRATVAAWLATDTLRADLLDPGFTRAGVSVRHARTGPLARPVTRYAVVLT